MNLMANLIDKMVEIYSLLKELKIKITKNESLDHSSVTEIQNLLTESNTIGREMWQLVGTDPIQTQKFGLCSTYTQFIPETEE